MKIDIVLMASGSSKRFGSENKLMHIVNGKPMFCHALDNALALKSEFPEIIDNITVVSVYDEIRKICNERAVKFIYNPFSHEGISASLRLGVESSDKDNSVMFMVCDQPYLKTESLKDLIKKYILSDYSIACFKDSNDNILSPTIFSPEYRGELLKIEGDRGGKGVVIKNISDTLLVEIDESEIRDIDTLA